MSLIRTDTLICTDTSRAAFPAALRLRHSTLAIAITALVLSGCGGGGGAGGSGIPGISVSVPALAALQSYSGPQLTVPRYGHTTTILPNGLALVIGGSDERHFTAIDEVEIFDQRAGTPAGEPTPETIVGDFIDQDIDGNLIMLPGGGRFWHTANDIGGGRVVVIGGTTNLLLGIANPTTVIFDPLTRTFTEPTLQVDPADDIVFPRVRHTVEELPNGTLLVVGGQESVQVSVGGGGLQRAFPTLDTLEVFDPAALSFSIALDNNGITAELSSPRGRAGHAIVPFAGFNQGLGNSDDIFAILGGFESLSALSLQAPQDLVPWRLETTKVSAVDLYDSASGSVLFAQGLALTERVNDPIALNLGVDHPSTPFGNPGMGNIVLVFGGDSDDVGCPDGPGAVGSTDQAELLVATFTGFGLANGVMLNRFTGAAMTNLTNPLQPATSNTYDSGHEILIHALAPINGCATFNRSRTAGVLMDMRRRYGGPIRVTSVVVTAGGIDSTVTPTGCVQTIDQFCLASEIAGFEFFDPFYDPSLVGTTLPLQPDLDGDGDDDLFPWTIIDNAGPANPLGIAGTWLSYDTLIPDDSVTGYADGFDLAALQTVPMKEARCMHTMDRIAGVDGVLGNINDRVLVIGGSDAYFPLLGDAPSSISCEVFVPPDA